MSFKQTLFFLLMALNATHSQAQIYRENVCLDDSRPGAANHCPSRANLSAARDRAQKIVQALIDDLQSRVNKINARDLTPERRQAIEKALKALQDLKNRVSDSDVAALDFLARISAFAPAIPLLNEGVTASSKPGSAATALSLAVALVNKRPDERLIDDPFYGIFIGLVDQVRQTLTQAEIDQLYQDTAKQATELVALAALAVPGAPYLALAGMATLTGMAAFDFADALQTGDSRKIWDASINLGLSFVPLLKNPAIKAVVTAYVFASSATLAVKNSDAAFDPSNPNYLNFWTSLGAALLSGKHVSEMGLEVDGGAAQALRGSELPKSTAERQALGEKIAKQNRGSSLSTAEREVIEQAHREGMGERGKDPSQTAGYGNYNRAQLTSKVQAFVEAYQDEELIDPKTNRRVFSALDGSFDKKLVNDLIRSGVAGEESKPVDQNSKLWENGVNPITGRELIFDSQNPFEVLGLDPATATTDDAKYARGKIAQNYHPDKGSVNDIMAYANNAVDEIKSGKADRFRPSIELAKDPGKTPSSTRPEPATRTINEVLNHAHSTGTFDSQSRWDVVKAAREFARENNLGDLDRLYNWLAEMNTFNVFGASGADYHQLKATLSEVRAIREPFDAEIRSAKAAELAEQAAAEDRINRERADARYEAERRARNEQTLAEKKAAEARDAKLAQEKAEYELKWGKYYTDKKNLLGDMRDLAHAREVDLKTLPSGNLYPEYRSLKKMNDATTIDRLIGWYERSELTLNERISIYRAIKNYYDWAKLNSNSYPSGPDLPNPSQIAEWLFQNQTKNREYTNQLEVQNSRLPGPSNEAVFSNQPDVLKDLKTLINRETLNPTTAERLIDAYEKGNLTSLQKLRLTTVVSDYVKFLERGGYFESISNRLWDFLDGVTDSGGSTGATRH